MYNFLVEGTSGVLFVFKDALDGGVMPMFIGIRVKPV